MINKTIRYGSSQLLKAEILSSPLTSKKVGKSTKVEVEEGGTDAFSMAKWGRIKIKLYFCTSKKVGKSTKVEVETKALW